MADELADELTAEESCVGEAAAPEADDEGGWVDGDCGVLEELCGSNMEMLGSWAASSTTKLSWVWVVSEI